MTERELRRTALVIPPKGRAVLCIWAAAAGLFLAPFAFWQSVSAGAVDLNLFGTVLPTMVFVDVMAKNKKGAIVNFCSESALRPLTRAMGFSQFKIEGRGLGSALILEFLLHYMTKPAYQLRVREEIYLDNMLDLF